MCVLDGSFDRRMLSAGAWDHQGCLRVPDSSRAGSKTIRPQRTPKSNRSGCSKLGARSFVLIWIALPAIYPCFINRESVRTGYTDQYHRFGTITIGPARHAILWHPLPSHGNNHVPTLFHPEANSKRHSSIPRSEPTLCNLLRRPIPPRAPGFSEIIAQFERVPAQDQLTPHLQFHLPAK
jgi:hypothetical protein